MSMKNKRVHTSLIFLRMANLYEIDLVKIIHAHFFLNQDISNLMVGKIFMHFPLYLV